MIVVKDDDEVFGILFAFMEKSNDEADDEVLLLDLKENLNCYSMKN